MKTKKLLTGILAGLASVCIALGIGNVNTTQSKAEETTFTEVDVTEDIYVHFWEGSEEKDGYQFLINVYPPDGDGTSYNINGYSGNGSALYFNETPDVNGCDVMKYIQVNGVTIRDVVGESGTAGSQVNGGSYTSTNSEFGENGKLAPFRLRTMRFSSMKLNTFDLYISADYIENVVGGLENLEITVKAGIEWKTMPNKDGVNQLMKTTRDRTFVITENTMSPKVGTSTYLSPKTFEEVDITKKVKIHYWANTEANGTENPNYTFLINFGAGINVKPFAQNGTHFYFNDHASDYAKLNGGDLMEYLQINGVTAREVVGADGEGGANNGWAQSTDSGFTVKAFAPIQLKSWNYKEGNLDLNGFELVLTKEFIDKTCGGIDNLEITLEEGFVWKTKSDKALKITQTFTYEAPENATPAVNPNKYFDIKLPKVDITDAIGGLTVSPFEKFYSINGMVSGTETWAPFCGTSTDDPGRGTSMYLNDHANDNGCDLASYILINGVSARSVMGDTSYNDFTTLEWTNNKIFKPIVINADGRNGNISIEITKEYLERNNNNTLEGLEITLKTGFEWKNIDNKVLYTTKDITWKYKTDKFEVKSACTVTFEGYDPIEVLSGDMIPADKIPADPTKESTAEKTFTFKGWYYTDNSGEEFVFKPDQYPVLEDMTLYPVFKEETRKYTVTLLNENGETVSTQEIACGSQIQLQEVPTKAHYTGTWVFQGGQEPLVMPKEDVTYKAVYTAIEYTVTFYKAETGTEVLATETYTVEDKEINAPEVPAKEGYTGTWATYELNGGNVEVRPVYEVAETPDTPADSKGCGSTLTGLTTVGLALAVAVMIKKKED